MAVYSVVRLNTNSPNRGFLESFTAEQWAVFSAKCNSVATTTAAMTGDRCLIGRATDGTTPTANTPAKFSTRSPAAPDTTTLFGTWGTNPTVPADANTLVIVSVLAGREDMYGFPAWQPGRSCARPLAQDGERLDFRQNPAPAAGELCESTYIAGHLGSPPPPGRFGGRRPRTRGDWVYVRAWQQMTAGADTLARGLRQITWGVALQLPRNVRYAPNEFLNLLGEPPAGGDATVTPATIACTTTLPQPGVGVGAAPAAVAALAALPAAAVGVGAAPAAAATTAALPQAAVGVGAAPSVVPAVAALPQPAVSVGAAPAVLAATVALPQAAVGVGAAPSVIAAVVALPLPTSVGQSGDAIVEPAVLAAVAALPAATVSVGAAPAAIPVVASLPQAAVGVGVAPAVVPVVVTLPQATIIVHALVQPAVIAALVALPAVAVSVGVAPAVITLLVALPLPDQVGGVIVNVNPEGPVQIGAIIIQSDATLGATTQPAVLQGTIS